MNVVPADGFPGGELCLQNHAVISSAAVFIGGSSPSPPSTLSGVESIPCTDAVKPIDGIRIIIGGAGLTTGASGAVGDEDANTVGADDATDTDGIGIVELAATDGAVAVIIGDGDEVLVAGGDVASSTLLGRFKK